MDSSSKKDGKPNQSTNSNQPKPQTQKQPDSKTQYTYNFPINGEADIASGSMGGGGGGGGSKGGHAGAGHQGGHGHPAGHPNEKHADATPGGQKVAGADEHLFGGDRRNRKTFVCTVWRCQVYTGNRIFNFVFDHQSFKAGKCGFTIQQRPHWGGFLVESIAIFCRLTSRECTNVEGDGIFIHV